ncbi:MAG: 50S ribosomal protein L1 [Patescibacteria group bacterium]|nr:50S ribosomal protein L1 [Patescibacteria group bacterium]
MKRSKRYKLALDKIDKSKKYSLEEALKLIKEDKVKFDQGVEIHVRLGIDPKKGEQLVRGQVVLPKGTGKAVKIMAFVSPEKEDEAKKAGADIVGGESDIENIKATQKVDFDVAVATPDMMKKIGPIAKILGQKGLMPNPKTGTIGPNIGPIIEELKKGKVTFKNDDSANLHQLVGKLSFEDKDLLENIKAFMEAVNKAKPTKSKGTYVKSVVLCTSQGPSIKVNI